MDEKIVILITTGSEDEALRIARALVEEHLAACANIVSGVRSIYRWKGDICDDREFLMMVKTRRAHFSRVEERVRQLHSYEVPEIISFSIQEGNDAYLQWMEEQTLE